MPQNHPEIWLGRVIDNLEKGDVATWLEGIAEIATNVTTINEGTLSEKQIIHVPVTDFDVDVLINNTTYPIEVQQYDDDTIQITLDKYQTKVTSVSDDDTIGASYDKIDTVTKSHVKSIKSNKFNKSLHALAPAADSVATPVIEATGGGGATPLTDPSGRLRLVYDDLVEAKRRCKGKGWRAVLTQDHWNDLLLDRKNFGDQLVNYKEGMPSPKIAGFELHKFDDGTHPVFDTNGDKKAFGAIPVATDKEASVLFRVDSVAKKTGITKQYFIASAQNPRTQANELNYRHYFVATPYQAKGIGAII
ncbi:hypothetical protein [Mesoflavibacter sp. CH_XMU1404-2]|uniref:hypothetical protein n=1 Tax=Mesoflavibacter sp. CH_XMU1404-2 TaxID=3107766 RepID=UPI00300A11F2